MVKKIWAKLFTCPKCGYTWIPRVKNPKECPRCKKRLE
jgi:rubrerythrin